MGLELLLISMFIPCLDEHCFAEELDETIYVVLNLAVCIISYTIWILIERIRKQSKL